MSKACHDFIYIPLLHSELLAAELEIGLSPLPNPPTSRG